MRKQNPNRRNRLLEILLYLAVAVVSMIYLLYSMTRIEDEQVANVLQLARSLETTLPKKELKLLEAKPDDIYKPQYQIVKNVLEEIIRVNPKARFAYIYTERKGRLFFYADSEPVESKDYSPPGQEYTEAAFDYMQPFKEGHEFFTNPVSDRWGKWVSALIPIKDEVTGKTIAVFGMDINASSWENLILFELVESVVITIAFLLLTFISIRIIAKKKELKNEIANRKQADNLLQQTRLNYEIFFNTIDEFLFVLDEQGNIVQTNTTVINRLGYSREELAGLSVLMVHPPERRDEAGRIVGEMLAGTTEICPVPIMTKSGAQISVETRVSRGIWDGKPVIFGVTKDISQIALSEEKFSKVFHLNPSACGLSDLDNNKYIEVNDAFCTLLGFDKSEVTGKTAMELEIFSPETRNSILQKADSRGSIINVEAELKAKNGDIKQVLLSAENIYLQDKKLRYTVVNDITGRKQAENEIQFQNKELKKLNAQKDKFFSIIGHDLRNPIAAITGFSNLLVEQLSEKDYEGVEKYAEIILQSSERTMELLKNLLEWSQSQAERMEFYPEYFDLVELLIDTELLLTGAAKQKSITLTKALPLNLPVFADKAMISTVFRNLISNAIKFTHPKGEITISAEETRNEIKVSVNDNGVGISKASIEKLFRMGENNSIPGTNKEQGNSLGLRLCKEFVEKHDGKIWVESEEGKGSTFYFTLPAKISLRC